MADRAQFLKLARARFKQAEVSEHEQRRRELDDLAFYAGSQWPEDIKKAREGQPAANGMPPIPAQPTLTINKSREPVRQVLNQADAAEIAIELAPADDFGDDTMDPAVEAEIELREGLVRRIQRTPEASDAFDWSGSRATIAGRGYFVVMTRYLPGKTNNQEIYLRNLYNQSSVTLDPAHEQKDGSDAEWGFIGTDMPWEQYQAEFPKDAEGKRNRVLSATSSEDFRALGDEAPDWFTVQGETRSCRVVEYWHTVRTTRMLATLASGDVAWEDELTTGTSVTETRPVIEKTIKWAKIDGVNVLEETDWPGPDMPIVKVLGEELHPYDQERRIEGMIRPMRDSGQGFNAMVSKLVSDIGYAPVPPFQATPEQIQGFEALYAVANTRHVPVLLYNNVGDAGDKLGPPTRTNIDTPIMAVTAAIQMFNEAIQSTSGVHDPSLGKVDPSLKSGKALMALQQQSAHGTSHYMSNRQRSLRYAGQVINNLLYPIYGAPGRLARIITGTGEAKTIKMAAPGVQSVNGQKVYRLTKDAGFNVAVKMTPSFQTRREQEANILAQLLQANPLLLTWFGDLFFKHQDGPGHQEMAERAKLMLDPKIQQLLEQEKQGGPQIPPQVQAQIQAQQQQIQAAEAAMAELKQALDTKKVEQEAKIKIAALQADQAVHLQKLKDATAIAVAQINATKGAAIADTTAQLELIALDHEAQQADADRQHATATQQADQAHASETQAADHSQASQLADQQHQQTLETNQQQADLAPAPTTET